MGLPKQYPVEGAKLILTRHKEELGDLEIKLGHCLGAARLFDCTNEEGQHGIIALQPDGSWWLVRDFWDDDEHIDGEEWKD